MQRRCVLVLLFAAAGARAAPRPVTFDEALGLATHLPTVAASREVARHERALELPASWSPLQILFTPVWRFAPADARGLEGSVSVQGSVPLDDVTGARRRALDASADVHAATANAAAIAARLEVAAAWIQGWAARERLAAARDDLAVARRIATVTERAATAGSLTAPELADARAFAADAELRVLAAEGAVVDAGLATADAMNEVGEVASAGPLPAPPVPAESEHGALVARAGRAPEAVVRRMSARAARLRAVEERALRATHVVVGASVGRDGPGALYGGISVGLTLPFDHGEREVAAARSTALLADAEEQLETTRARNDLERALHEVEHSARVVAVLATAVVPTARDAAALRQRAFELGEATILETLTSRRAAIDATARLAEARASHAWARVKTWILVGALTEAP